jgi:hypothetical protein
MTGERRGNGRVYFSQPLAAWMMAIDGTWRRSCFIKDISENGAQLSLTGSLEGLQVNEFFLLLSSTGLAYRRCGLVWVDGDQIGVSFIKTSASKSKSRRE